MRSLTLPYRTEWLSLGEGSTGYGLADLAKTEPYSRLLWTLDLGLLKMFVHSEFTTLSGSFSY